MSYLYRPFQGLAERGGERGGEGLLGSFGGDCVESRRRPADRPPARARGFPTLCAVLRYAVVMLRIAYRRVHGPEAPASRRAPAD